MEVASLGSTGLGCVRRRVVGVVLVPVSGCERKTEVIGHPGKERIRLRSNFWGHVIRIICNQYKNIVGVNVGGEAINSIQAGRFSKISNMKEGKDKNTVPIGPEEEELNGHSFEERKRQSSDSHDGSCVSKDMNMVNTYLGFSVVDYTESSPNFSATLARQASLQQ